MLTLKGSKKEPAAQGSRVRTHSDEDLATIADLVVVHDMPNLPAHMLVRLDCKRWHMWDPFHFNRIVNKRRLDDSHDWYFPIISKGCRKLEASPQTSTGRTIKKRKPRRLQESESDSDSDTDTDTDSDSDLDLDSGGEEQVQHPQEHLWSLKGIWHSSAHQAESEMARSIPPMTFLPQEWLQNTFPRGDILDIQGGLFLIKGAIGTVPLRRSGRLNPDLVSNNGSSISDTTPTTICRRGWRVAKSKSLAAQRWTRLLVSNPLTRECRELPAANCTLLGLRSWDSMFAMGVGAALLVNEDSNSYRVILTCIELIAVYTSSTNSWHCLLFPQDRPWTDRCDPMCLGNPEVGIFGDFTECGYHWASAHDSGRLYFADTEGEFVETESVEPTLNAQDVGAILVYEVDLEAGNWSCRQEYFLRKFHVPSLLGGFEGRFPFDMIIRQYKILECHGEFYAVMFAMVHDVFVIGDHQSEEWTEQFLGGIDETGNAPDCMPVCFYIMQLPGQGSGAGVDHGVLRIQIPRSRPDFHSRAQHMLTLSRRAREQIPRLSVFSCQARKRMIWVACEDYLLSYDVATRKTTTEIIPWNPGSSTEFGDRHLGGLAYTPSLHMRP